MTVNGVQPSFETAQNKTWPISRDLYLFTAGEASGAAKKLIDYMCGADGQKLVRESGFVPITTTK